MRKVIVLILVAVCVTLSAEGTLFVGLESSDPPTYYSDMEGFPNINWQNLFNINVSGAAATPDGRIYLCEGAFTTHLYQARLDENPQQVCTIDEDMSALAYGRDSLWGYSNYADPRGIYSIDAETGEVALALSTGSKRFFALDYNPEDDLFYGYTEYDGPGLYSINIDSGEMIQLTGSIPATNGQGRGMAVGDNTVFLTATRGDDGIPYFAYDISQGAGGEWVEFPNPYPEYHSTGGAAWIAAPDLYVSVTGIVTGSDYPQTGISDCQVYLYGEENYQTETDENGVFLFPEVFHYTYYELEIVYPSYLTYYDEFTAEDDDIDLGTIILTEQAFPPEDVEAEETVEYEEVTVTWQPPGIYRELVGYMVYRFPEEMNTEPENWELLADSLAAYTHIDSGWAELEEGMWQYAVAAEYSNLIFSEPVLSNPLQKIVTEADNNDVLGETVIQSIYPNPFNPVTTMTYNLINEGYTEISVYNIKGQKVNTLLNKYQKPGRYLLSWDGKDFNGNALPSGLYLFILRIDNRIISQEKALLLK